MDDELKKLFAQVLRLLASQDEDVLRLIAEMTVLQRRVAKLAGVPWPEMKQSLEVELQQTLATLDIAQRQKSMRELMDLFERHGKDFGKHEA